MSKKETVSDSKKKKKGGNLFKYILLFILFLVIGLGIGVLGTIKFLDMKDNENEKDNQQVVDDGPKDITEDKNSQVLINNLGNMLNHDIRMYSTKGLNVSTMDNTTKLILVYNYYVKNNKIVNEVLTSEWLGATTCKDNTFITDPSDNTMVSSNQCTVFRIQRSALMDINKKLFNDEVLDTSVPFNPVNGKSCVIDGETYLCGNVLNNAGYTGALESRFEIKKVTKADDGTIEVYEKGYLIDLRSHVNNPNDAYDNYYLHSSDSRDYYYELKSADNLTFKHTYKTTDKENYYYVSSELVKE